MLLFYFICSIVFSIIAAVATTLMILYSDDRLVLESPKAWYVITITQSATSLIAMICIANAASIIAGLN